MQWHAMILPQCEASSLIYYMIILFFNLTLFVVIIQTLNREKKQNLIAFTIQKTWKCTNADLKIPLVICLGSYKSNTLKIMWLARPKYVVKSQASSWQYQLQISRSKDHLGKNQSSSHTVCRSVWIRSNFWPIIVLNILCYFCRLYHQNSGQLKVSQIAS